MRGAFFYALAAAVCAAVFTAASAAKWETDWRSMAGPDGAPDNIGPISAPFPMPQLTRPAFPAATFSIADYGAVGDGVAKNTAAIRATIEACANAGGGTVVIPAGTWVTGAIHLKSNVNLHLAEGATLRFSDDPADYLPVVFTRWAGFECYNYSPLIYARDCENIAITGPGKIEGNGRAWWPWAERQSEAAMRMYREKIVPGVPVGDRVYGTPEGALRPQFISPINCRNVLLEGFTIAEPGPFWTIDLVYCDRVVVRKLRVFTQGGPNNDGLNVDSSTNVLIEHCFFETGDDCVCMKSGMNEDGWRVGKPTENVVCRYNITGKGHGGAVFGSDMSGDIRNVFVHSSIFDGTNMGIRLKSTRGRGGVVERIWCENIDMKNIAGDAIQITTAYNAYLPTTEGKAPVFRDLHFSNINVNGAKFAAQLEGLPEAPLQNLDFKNINISANSGFHAKLANTLELNNVHVTAQKGPPFHWTRCKDVKINGKTE
ncbi:MAG TPA: glycoside hydrolase family 28 protein [Candidatus Bathyarchaeia archaeon]|nr:glycoside hydrolase family 28 protein [Candidatus Bathyarchaeia archaeon]